MAKEYVPIFYDWLDTTQDLTAEEKGNLIDAVVAYASGQEYEHLLTGGCKIAFRFMKGQIDRNTSISEARSKAGSNKQEQVGTNDSKPEQTGTNDNKPEQTETKSLNNNKKQEQEQKQKTKTKRKNENDPAFDAFWAAYPNKKAKPDALRAWGKLKPDDEMAIQIMAGLERWKGSGEWDRDGGQYIPHPATWLNRHSWEDEVQPVTRGPTRTVPAQRYEQRSYAGETDEAMAAFLAANGIEIGGQS